MENLNLKLITKNIFKLLDYSGVNDISFSQILDISEKQLRLIKNSKAEFSISNINKSCDFFCVKLSSINNEIITLENDYRTTLTLKQRKNLEYSSLLELRPSIRHAIRFILIHNYEFINQGLTAGEINNLLQSHGWKYSSRYISTAMGRNHDLVKIVSKRIQNGKEVNVYGVVSKR